MAAEEWDIFISHASEDKVEVTRPLANILSTKGIKVWLDESELFVGDSLRGKIDEGLACSQFGIVILSPSFFSKHWPQAELDGLAAQEARRASAFCRFGTRWVSKKFVNTPRY